MAVLDSAQDLSGVDLGGGNVRLKWSYPVDIVAQQIAFDVYGGTHPTDAFRIRFAAGVAALEIDLNGFGFAGDRYFTVVARRDDLLSLPAKLLALAVRPSTISRALSAAVGTAGGPVAGSGLGFPFGITANGAVFSQGGDPLLQSKVLQLLLTIPGERVNLPDYGTRLLDLVFDPNSDVLAATTQFFVARALQNYLGDEIQVGQVLITNNDATLFVDIAYVRKEDARAEQLRVGVPLPVPGATP